MIKKLTLLIFLINITWAEILQLDLVTFSNLASESNKINILIDEKLKDEKFVFSISSNKDYLLTAFRKALNLKGLQLIQNESFFYVEKKQIFLEIPEYRTIKINFVKFEDIKDFLSIYKDIEFNFINTSKLLLIKSTNEQFQSIYNIIKAIDRIPKELLLKITIVETNINKLKEYGLDLRANLSNNNNTNLFFNLISYPFSINNTLSSQQTNQFYSFLKIVNEKEITEFISNPTITITDEKETVFKTYEDISYSKGTTKIENNQTITTDTTEYKEVGLSLKVKPSIYTNDNVYLDLDFEASNIVSYTNNVPNTSNKILKQMFNIKIGETLVLTGINKTTVSNNEIGIPVLKDLPFLGKLFTYEYDNKIDTNLTIIFELINK